MTLTKAELMKYLETMQDSDEIRFCFLGTESEDYDDRKGTLKVQHIQEKMENKIVKGKFFPMTINLETNEN